MQLYAYGGTKHAMRQCIGRLRGSFDSAQSDRTGLVEGRISYGCVVIDGEQALLARTLQGVPGGRNYPFFLLLRPDARTWSRFDWDAALLLRALLADDETRCALFEKPEQLTEEGLSRLIEGVTPLPVKAAAAGARRTDIWWGAAFDAGPATLRHQQLDWSALPDPGQMAAFLKTLPIALRPARGWLVGGGTQLARALNAGLLISDEEPAPGADPARNLEQQGQALRRAWVELAGSGPAAASLADHERMPLWQWAGKWDQPLTEFHERLLLLAELRRSGGITEQGRSILATVVADRPLAAELRATARKTILSNPGDFRDSDLDLLLQWWRETSDPVESADAQALSADYQARVVALLRDRGTLDNGQVGALVAGGVWDAAVSGGEPEAIVGYLRLALLAEREGRVERKAAERLITKAIQATAADPLVWLQAREDKSFWDRIRGQLRQSVRDLCKAGDKSSTALASRYLAFADDPKASELASIASPGVRKDIIRDLARQALRLDPVDRGAEGLDGERDDWLGAIADGSLRSEVEIDLRIGLARKPLAGWRWLANLDSIMRGQTVTGLGMAPSREREQLVAELKEGFRAGQWERNFPAIKNLDELFGRDLPPELRKRIEHAPIEAFASIATRLAEDRTPDAELREHLLQALSRSELGQGLLEKFKEAVDDPPRAAALCRRLGDAESFLDVLLLFLRPAEQDRLVSALAHADQEAFRNAAGAHRARPNPDSLTQAVVRRFLDAPEGHGVMPDGPSGSRILLWLNSLQLFGGHKPSASAQEEEES